MDVTSSLRSLLPYRGRSIDRLADLRLDPQTLITAILHDVIEDTPTRKASQQGAAGRDLPRDPA